MVETASDEAAGSSVAAGLATGAKLLKLTA
jgi:hypothetical protein